jgi:cell division protein FtsA
MRVYTGIDIGTQTVKVAIAQEPEHPDAPLHIIGTGSASSRGLRHGYAVDPVEASKCVRDALQRAQASAKVKVTQARVAIGGVGLDEIKSSADISLTSSGGFVTPRDVERVLREVEKRAGPKLLNRTIIHTVPLEFRVDGVRVFGKPEGLQGTKLAVDALLITMLEKHHDDIVSIVENAGIEVQEVMASPLAASLATLTKSQKNAGVALANIGSETLSIIVFDNDLPVSLKVFPLGGSEVTNALALSFQLPLAEAEQLKRGAVTGSDISEKKMQTIINARVKDMFTLISSHLKTIGRHQLLPAGIVITGGGSGLISVTEIARAVLRIPSQIGGAGTAVRTAGPTDAAWSVAYGLCRWGYMEDASRGVESVGDVLRKMMDSVRRAFASLLP